MLATPSFAKLHLYVENTFGGDVTVIAIPEHEVVGSFHASARPDDVAASPDGRTIYVNSQGSLADAPNEVIAFDSITGAVRWRIPVDGLPHHLSLTADGRRLFVPYFDKGYTSIIDTVEKREIDRVFGVFGAHGTRLSPDDKRLYVGSLVTDALYVVDIATGEATQVMQFDDGVRPFAITNDESRMYVQVSRLHGFDVVDLDTGRIMRRIHLPDLPADTTLMKEFPHTVDHGIELSPDERYLFAAASAGHYVAVYSHPELELIKQIPTGKEPNWIVFAPDGRYAYVSSRISNDISVIDVARLEEVQRVPVTGNYPQRMKIVDVPAEHLELPGS
jgi:YVTN family beta-propeller protein